MGDCGVDVQDDDDGIALPNLDHVVQEKNSNYVRPFRFAEFFAGWGGLSSSMTFEGGDWIEVSATLDGFNLLVHGTFWVMLTLKRVRTFVNQLTMHTWLHRAVL